jgi:hypothetical protein
MKGQVGIFWVYKGRLMALPIPLDQAETRGIMLDSPDAHVQVWPRMVARYKGEFPVLTILEYEEVPRGRVIFDTATRTFILYIDATLFIEAQSQRGPLPAVWEALRPAFKLDGQRVRFATDPHDCIQPWAEEDDDWDGDASDEDPLD